MADVLLKAENLTASYGQIEVLHGISFEVFDNEIAVILGANGAGKTTTIRALSGMVETTGTITFKEKILANSNLTPLSKRRSSCPSGKRNIS